MYGVTSSQATTFYDGLGMIFSLSNDDLESSPGLYPFHRWFF